MLQMELQRDQQSKRRFASLSFCKAHGITIATRNGLVTSLIFPAPSLQGALRKIAAAIGRLSSQMLPHMDQLVSLFEDPVSKLSGSIMPGSGTQCFGILMSFASPRLRRCVPLLRWHSECFPTMLSHTWDAL